MRNIQVTDAGDSADDLAAELYNAMNIIADAEKVIKKLTVHKRNYVACDDPVAAMAEDKVWRESLINQLKAVKVEVYETSRLIYNQKTFEPTKVESTQSAESQRKTIEGLVKPKR